MHDIDPSQLEIELNSRMDSPWSDMEALLESDEGLLVGRLGIGQSQLLVVSNGSFLLNATLVNHEHRKLAGKLVDTIGPKACDVVFLESGELKTAQPPGPNPAGGPSPSPFGSSPDEQARPTRQQAAGNEPLIRRTDPVPEMPNGLELFLQWPTNWIGLHFALVGILFLLLETADIRPAATGRRHRRGGFRPSRRCRRRLAAARRRPPLCPFARQALPANRHQELRTKN